MRRDAKNAGYARDTGSDPTQFYAVTGEAVPLTVPPWNANEPNNGGGTGTEETTVWFSFYDDLVDSPYFAEQAYACECDHRPVTKTFTLH